MLDVLALVGQRIMTALTAIQSWKEINVSRRPENVIDALNLSVRSENSEWVTGCQRTANQIRRRVLGTVLERGGGYLAQACSASEILSYLYCRAMNLGPSAGPAVPARFTGAPSSRSRDRIAGAVYNGEKRPDTDRFFLSPTHYALVLYAALIETGRLDSSALAQLNADDSTVNEIGEDYSPGVETNGGSFGQTISQAAGVAWARKKRGDTGKVWVFLGDGECQEGQTWEAIMAMAFHKLDNVQIIVDVNGQQADGRTETVMSNEPLEARFSAFGAESVRVDGHDVLALDRAFATPHAGRPLVVVADTSPISGIPPLADRKFLHYITIACESERARFQQTHAELDAND